MKEAVAIIENLTNVQAISLLRQLNRNLFTAVPYKDVQENLDKELEEIELLKTLDLETKKQNLDSKSSVEITKFILMAFAKDIDFAPALVQAWDEIKDDDALFIETIVAVGLIVNLTIFMATSEIEFKIGNLKLKKGKADAGILKEIMKPVVEIIKRIPASS
jgi:hypothetical protein